MFVRETVYSFRQRAGSIGISKSPGNPSHRSVQALPAKQPLKHDFSSQASKILYKPPEVVYIASYREPLGQSDYWKFFVHHHHHHHHYLQFCKRCVPTSRWSRFSKKLRGKCCRGAPTRPLTRGFWAREQSAFFDVRVCHPNADSYKNLTPEQIYKLHENNKKRLYSSRVLEVERGTFTPLAFTTTGGMSNECQSYHSRLAELLAVKKQESYATTIAWIRTRVSFAILRSALTCLRGSRSRRRTIPNIQETDLELEVSTACR